HRSRSPARADGSSPSEGSAKALHGGAFSFRPTCAEPGHPDQDAPALCSLLAINVLACTDRRPQCPGGLKLYVPSQYQRFVVGLYVTITLASKPRNCPVPPENVTTPERVANESVTWPNALFPGPV